jgi:hypothetical protein
MLGIHSFSDIETTSIYAWILTTIIIMLRRSERAVVLYSSRRSNGYEDKIQIILF